MPNDIQRSAQIKKLKKTNQLKHEISYPNTLEVGHKIEIKFLNESYLWPWWSIIITMNDLIKVMVIKQHEKEWWLVTFCLWRCFSFDFGCWWKYMVKIVKIFSSIEIVFCAGTLPQSLWWSLKWLLSEAGKEEVTVSLENLQSNTDDIQIKTTGCHCY